MQTKRLLTTLLIVALLLQSAMAALAQDDPAGEANDQSAERLFLPMVGQGGGTPAAADEQGTEQTGEGLQPVDGGMTLLSIEQTEKDEVSAAGADDFTLVSLIVTFDESIHAAGLAELPDAHIVHRYKEVFNGISLVTAQRNLGAIAELPGVTGVYVDELLQLNPRSPRNLSAPPLPGMH